VLIDVFSTQMLAVDEVLVKWQHKLDSISPVYSK
jgi:hypothetical protein